MGEHSKSASTKAKDAAASSMAAAAAGSTAAAALAAAGQMQQQQQLQQQLQQLQQASTSGSAGITSSTATAKDTLELQEIRNLLWGPTIRLDVFRRWSQGRCFNWASRPYKSFFSTFSL